MTTPSVVHFPKAENRCPLAGAGLDSPSMAACPGFEATRLGPAEGGPGAQIDGATCAHLTATPGGRGFIPTCALPGGPPVAAGTLPMGPRRVRTAEQRAV